MPWGDRTGPMGEGPMTGRRMGFCSGYSAPGYASRPYPGRGGRFGGGYGYGRGHGAGPGGYGGRGFRHWYYATGIPGWARGWAPPEGWPVAGAAPDVAPTDEKSALRAQAEYLEAALKDIRERMSEIESSDDE
jgi:hypothetical protein